MGPAAIIVTGAGAISVPDGGVRVLGSVGYLSEAHNEGGVPILGKVPYLDRGFRNVGHGRSAGTIQRLVSVRIIIMEEEEARFLGNR